MGQMLLLNWAWNSCSSLQNVVQVCNFRLPFGWLRKYRICLVLLKLKWERKFELTQDHLNRSLHIFEPEWGSKVEALFGYGWGYCIKHKHFEGFLEIYLIEFFQIVFSITSYGTQCCFFSVNWTQCLCQRKKIYIFPTWVHFAMG